MKIRVLAVGTRIPGWVQAGVTEYQKRFPREWRFEWVELPLGPRSKSKSSSRSDQKAIVAEGESMLAAIKPHEQVIALDVTGKRWKTESLARQVEQWQLQREAICLLIGGPDGLSPTCLTRANQCWSLSDLTLPHLLVRVVLAEQLYRCWSLLNKHPYHK